MATEQQHFDAARKFQAYYQESLNNVGVRVPPPRLGDTVNTYRKEVLRQLKRTFLQNHDLGKINCRGLPADALAIFEPQMIAACVNSVNDASHLEPGELRKVERLDELGRVRCIDWVGQQHFTAQMMRPGRRVVSFKTDHGYVDASGRALR